MLRTSDVASRRSDDDVALSVHLHVAVAVAVKVHDLDYE